jgi:ABC-2 type transport system permease protein
MIAAFPIAGVTLRALLGRRRSLLMVLLAGLPVVLALLIRISGETASADEILDPLIVRTVLPLIALVFGTAALGSELEDGTAVYLMVKPVSRWRIVGAKMLVAAGLTVALVMPATVLTGLLSAGFGPTALGDTFAFALATAVGGIAYACAFVALSAFTTRALVVGLGYTLIWEGVLAGLLEATRFLSIRQATLGLAAGLTGETRPETLDVGTSVLILGAVVAGAFVLGSLRLARFEVRGGE